MIKSPFANCEECGLQGEPFVPSQFPKGPAGASIIVIGEAPGQEEVRQKVPFAGQSGQLLRAVLNQEGGNPEGMLITNTVLCRPPGNRQPTSCEQVCCAQRLASELQLWPEAVIVSVGAEAAEAVLGPVMPGKMAQTRGAWYSLDGRWILPTWHPAYILRNPNDAVEFIRDIRKALSGPPCKTAFDAPPRVVLLDTVAALGDALSGIHGQLVAFDFETSQISWTEDRVLMLGLAITEDEAFIIPANLLYDSQAAIAILDSFFVRNTFVGHNAKFDLHFAFKLGMAKARCDYDTMLAHYVLDERSTGQVHGLKVLVREYFNVRNYDQELVHQYLQSRNDDWSKVPEDKLAQYCAWDCVLTLALWKILRKELQAGGLFEEPFLSPVMALHELCFSMEHLGMGIDRDYMEGLCKDLEAELEERHAELCRISERPDLNPRSPKQLAEVIYDERKIPPPPTTTYDKIRGQINVNPRSTSAVALFWQAEVEDGEVIGYRDEFLQALFKYRRTHKILTTYVRRILDGSRSDGRYHDVFKVHGTETGRLSAYLHTVPRETSDEYGALLRRGFVPAAGYRLCMADFSQAELRVAAGISEDKFMLEIYRSGRDLHTEVNNAVFGTKEEIGERLWAENRFIIKRFNFAYLYGGGRSALVADANIPHAQALEFMSKYEAQMEGLASWKKAQVTFGMREGYIRSRFGRRRRFPVITKANVKDLQKAAVNAPIQSASSDITCLAALQLVKRGYRVIMTKHDEVILEIPEEDTEGHSETVRKVLEETGAKYFPEVPWRAEIEVRSRWSELPA